MADEADLASRGSGARRLVMLGPPGSGKGTQAERLSDALGVPAISTGEMLRQAVARGSELGQRVEGIMNSGALVDDDTMAAVVRQRLGEDDASRGFLLDGYPRTLDQTVTLDQILGDLEQDLDAVLLLEVPEDELVRRSLERGRADDTEEVIRERQRVYREKTEPLVKTYTGRDILVRIDGHQPMDRVTEALLAALADAEKVSA